VKLKNFVSVSIDRRISIGNILTIAAIVLGFFSTYAVNQYRIDLLEVKVEQNVKEINSLKVILPVINEKLDQQQKTLDRINDKLDAYDDNIKRFLETYDLKKR